MARRLIRITHLVQALGHDSDYWSRRVNGRVALSIDDLMAIAAFLEVDIKDLLRRAAA